MIADYALFLVSELIELKPRELKEGQNIVALVQDFNEQTPIPQRPDKDSLDTTPHEAYFDKRTPWDLKESGPKTDPKFKGYKPNYVRRELRYLYTNVRG